MSTFTLAHYLGRILRTDLPSALSELAREIVARFPDDEATHRLRGMIVVKVARLASAN
jgi:hypothetical protein